jgi:hypothetical protein
LESISQKKIEKIIAKGICDIILDNTLAIRAGIADYYAVPIHTTFPPPFKLTSGAAGNKSLLIIGDMESGKKHDFVAVSLSGYITDVSIVTKNQHDLNIKVTEGAGKCSFEKLLPAQTPEDSNWFRDNDGVHYSNTL